MTVKEFSRLSGKSENAIRRKLERGTLDGIKENGIWNITSDVYVDERFCSCSHYYNKGIIRINNK